MARTPTVEDGARELKAGYDNRSAVGRYYEPTMANTPYRKPPVEDRSLVGTVSRIANKPAVRDAVEAVKQTGANALGAAQGYASDLISDFTGTTARENKLLAPRQPAPAGRAVSGVTVSPGQRSFSIEQDGVTRTQDPTRGVMLGTAGSIKGRSAVLGDEIKNPVTYMNTNERNPATGRTALEEGALANSIRQQTIDAQTPEGAGFNKITIIPNSRAGNGGTEGQIARIYRNLDGETDPYKRSGMIRQARGLELDLGDQRQQANASTVAQTSLYNNYLDNQSADARAAASTVGLAEQRASATRKNNVAAMGLVPPDKMASAWADLSGGEPALDAEGKPTPAYTNFIMNSAGQHYDQMRGGEVRMAEGGEVPMVPGSAVGGAMAGVTPQQPDPAAVQMYQQYAMGAQQMGLPPVPFEAFLHLQQGAGMQAGAADAGPTKQMHFAGGGAVADGGRQVIDPNPNAPTDSIPAVIDEQHPAKLDSEEFIFPKDVVKHFGTDKLYKMIDQARQAMGERDGTTSAVSAAGQ